MEYSKEQVLIKQLPTAVFIKNFIQGHPADCEEYLKDFINLSKLVYDKGNEIFILRKHAEQSQGQTDVYNSFYELDFKILVDEKYMEAKSMLSNSMTEFCPGLIGIGRSRLPGANRTVSDVIKCLRNKTVNDLKNIEAGIVTVPESQVIKQIIKKVSVNKNILFFLPYDYSFKKVETDLDNIQFIIDYIAEDLEALINYRKMKVIKDTYIAFISGKYFVITQVNNNILIFYDMIRTCASELYDFLANAGRL